MSVCKRVFNVGFGPGFDSMSPARSWLSASHDAALHDWLPKQTGGLGLRRGRIKWIQFAQSLLTVAHQPRGFQRLPPARGGTAQKKIIHLANWSQLIHPGPASSLTKVFLVSSKSCVNADSLLIRAAATSTSGTLNDLTTDLIMANNNNTNHAQAVSVWCNRLS